MCNLNAFFASRVFYRNKILFDTFINYKKEHIDLRFCFAHTQKVKKFQNGWKMSCMLS